MIIYLILFALCLVLTYAYIRHAWRNQWVDIPNSRSSHTKLTPRGGGIVFIGLWIAVIIVALAWGMLPLGQAFIILPGTLLVAMTGFGDDRFDVPFYWRILFYFLAATLCILTLGGFTDLIINKNLMLPLGFIGSILAVLAIIWSTNLFNFMDGLDGIAATEAIFILSVGGYFAAQSDGNIMALLCWTLSVCILGFLTWNRPPAKVFMGDVGSATLGFIIMALALISEKLYHVPILLWLILYGVFLTDATLTLFRRLVAGEKIYEGHRLHAYQRLHQAGFSHQKVLLCVFLTNSFLALLALIGFYYQNYLLLCFATAFSVLLFLYILIERLKPMYPKLQ